MSKATEVPGRLDSPFSDQLGPLPEPAVGYCGGFTAAQMRAYALVAVAAEREWCKRAVYDATDWAHEEGDFVLKEVIVEWIDRGPNVGVQAGRQASPGTNS